MRTRNEILSDAERMVTNSRSREEVNTAVIPLILEVLLDLREILQEIYAK